MQVNLAADAFDVFFRDILGVHARDKGGSIVGLADVDCMDVAAGDGDAFFLGLEVRHCV